MNEREEPRPAHGDRDLVEWMGRHYAPPVETLARRSAFTEALLETVADECAIEQSPQHHTDD